MLALRQIVLRRLGLPCRFRAAAVLGVVPVAAALLQLERVAYVHGWEVREAPLAHLLGYHSSPALFI